MKFPLQPSSDSSTSMATRETRNSLTQAISPGWRPLTDRFVRQTLSSESGEPGRPEPCWFPAIACHVAPGPRLMDPVCHISRLRAVERPSSEPMREVASGSGWLRCFGSWVAVKAPGLLLAGGDWHRCAWVSTARFPPAPHRARGKRKIKTGSTLNPGENAPGGNTMAACVPPISGAVSAYRACAGQRKRTSCQLVLFSPRATLRRAPASVKLVEATCAMGTTRVTVGPQGVHPRLGGGVQCSTNLLSLTTACGVR